MFKMKASEVQKMLGVLDEQVIAHGYRGLMDVDRPRTVDVWFKDGKLVRAHTDDSGSTPEVQQSEYFESDFFHTDIKRWYESTINPKLRSFLETFGSKMCTTPSTHKYPIRMPDITGATIEDYTAED